MRLILTCLIAVLAASPVFSQKTKQLEQLLAAYDKADKFSGTVLVAEKGKSFLKKATATEMHLKKKKYE
jgi:hypothetical protein